MARSRSRADLHVAHHPGGVPGAQVTGGGLHVQQLHQAALAAALHFGLMEGERDVVSGRRLPGQADDAETVRAVGGDLKLHHVVVGADNGLDVIAGLYTLLLEDEDAVGDAVGKLGLLGVEVLQGADGIGLGVIGHQVALMDVGADGVRYGGGAAQIQAGVVAAVGLRSTLQHLGAHHGTEHLVPGLDVGGDGGFLWVQRLVVVQQGGGGDDGVGEVPLVQVQLAERAQHAVGHLAPELALLDLLASGEGGFVQGHRDQISRMNVPGPGDDLDGLSLTHIQLADPHVVGVGVADHRDDLSHHHVGDLLPQIVGELHLRTGQGHGLGKVFVIGVHRDELPEPFAR